ncbi:MAG: radical SAM protein [Candidatus Diapherotrites archaeon]|nr:radical SAM protein [Candidatus Diapherotrites archaeon]
MRKVFLVSASTSPKYHPLATASIKAFLERHPKIKKNFEIRLFNYCITDFDKKGAKANFVKAVKQDKPCLAAFSTYMWNAGIFLELAQKIKKSCKETRVLFGGQEVSQRYLENPNIDFLILGEGEEAFRDLLLSLLQKKSFEKIRGLWFKKNGKVQGNGMAFLEDLSALPSPYTTGVLPLNQLHGYMTVQFSRGCNQKCVYCVGNMVPFRRYSKKRILDELNFGVKNKLIFSFLLDTALNYDKRVLSFLRYLQKIKKPGQRIDFIECVSIHPNFDFEELFSILNKLEFDKSIQIGIQSLNPVALKNVNRNLSLSRLEKLIKLAKEKRIKLLFDFMIGLPGDDYYSFVKGLKYVVEKDAGSFCIALTKVITGTELHRRAGEFGIKCGSERGTAFRHMLNYAIESTNSFSAREIKKAILLSKVIQIENDIPLVPVQEYEPP